MQKDNVSGNFQIHAVDVPPHTHARARLYDKRGRVKQTAKAATQNENGTKLYVNI